MTTLAGLVPDRVQFDTPQFSATPVAPVITNGGLGAQTWGYRFVDYFNNGLHTDRSAEGTTNVGQLDLTIPGNENTITPPVAPAGLIERRFYRTTAPGGGTPNTTGLIATIPAAQAANPVIDNGLVAGAEQPVTTNTSGDGGSSDVGRFQNIMSFQITGGICTVQMQASLDNAEWFNVGAAMAGAGAGVVIQGTFWFMRSKMTAYVSGNPIVYGFGHTGG